MFFQTTPAQAKNAQLCYTTEFVHTTGEAAKIVLHPLRDNLQRAGIRQYVHESFSFKVTQMDELREMRKQEMRAEMARQGYGPNSSRWLLSSIEIEEECVTELLRQKFELYLDAHQREGLKMGPEVLRDIYHSHAEITAARRSALINEVQSFPDSTRRHQDLSPYRHLGKKALVAMKEIEATIDLYNERAVGLA